MGVPRSIFTARRVPENALPPNVVTGNSIFSITERTSAFGDCLNLIRCRRAKFHSEEKFATAQGNDKL